MNNCICCHDRLLRHINHHRVYWFCLSCHQEMPKLDEYMLGRNIEKVKAKMQN